MKPPSCFAVLFFTLSLALVADAHAADKPDPARPETWAAHPALKKKLDDGLAALKGYLRSLEPAVFAAKYADFVELAFSKDAEERTRAIKGIAVLHDLSGLPILVAVIEKNDGGRLQAVLALAEWVHDAYQAEKKVPPRELQPLLPLFVQLLVEAGDEPRLRDSCFQAIGCLAGPEWLPLVKDLAAGREPRSATAAWAVEQLADRPGPVIAAATATAEASEVESVLRTTYTLPAPDLATIKKNVKERLDREPDSPDGCSILYSTGIAHFDSWVPVPGTPLKNPPARDVYWKWYYQAGRVARVDFVDGGKAKLRYRVWNDDRHAPVLSTEYSSKDGDRWVVAWCADYDERGLIRRVVRLSQEFEVVEVFVFENGAGYSSMCQTAFADQGKFYWRARHIGDALLLLTREAPQEKQVNTGTALWWIRHLERYGLASIYPVPEPEKRPPRE